MPIPQRVQPDECKSCYKVLEIGQGTDCKTVEVNGYKAEDISDSAIYSTSDSKYTSERYLTQRNLKKETDVSREQVRVYCSSPLTGSAVVGVNREVEYFKEETAPLISKVEEDIKARYGEPSYDGTIRGFKMLQFSVDKAGSTVKLEEPLEVNANMYDQSERLQKAGIEETIFYGMVPCRGNSDKICVFVSAMENVGLWASDNREWKIFRDEIEAIRLADKEAEKAESAKTAVSPDL